MMLDDSNEEIITLLIFNFVRIQNLSKKTQRVFNIVFIARSCLMMLDDSNEEKITQGSISNLWHEVREGGWMRLGRLGNRADH